ncbi:hypothetical protein [Photobacterium leiognathi]|uniref:hypothetical protein n=1 Tax=Photobacterium leiognathi TaxID=553611 RepID=UPI002981946C|nr:hypothetical protein [Photobacterium leiognathi]
MMEDLEKMKRLLGVHLYGDVNGCTDFGDSFAKSVVTKNYRAILEVIGFAYKWNEKSKAAFCEFIGKPVVKTKKGMVNYVLEWCGLSYDDYLVSEEYFKAKNSLDNITERLKEKYPDFEKLELYIKKCFEDNCVEFRVINRKSYLVTPDQPSYGYHLKSRDVIDFAKISSNEYFAKKKFLESSKLVELHPSVA